MSSSKGKAFIRSDAPKVLISKRDLDHLQEYGWVSTPDMEWITGRHLVIEIDQDDYTSRVVGFADFQRSGGFNKVVAAARKEAKNPLVRVTDLVTKAQIAHRTKRSKALLTDRWQKKPDWPGPITRFGHQRIYYWPAVRKFMRRHGYPMVRQYTTKNGRKVGVYGRDR